MTKEQYAYELVSLIEEASRSISMASVIGILEVTKYTMLQGAMQEIEQEIAIDHMSKCLCN